MLASLIAAFVSGGTLRAVSRARRAAVAYAVAVAAALLGLIFLIVAAYVVAARAYGADYAALGFGAAFLVFAVVIVVVHRLLERSRRNREARQARADMTALAVGSGLAVLPQFVRGRGGIAAALIVPVVAAAAYYVYREWRGSGQDGEPPVE